MTDRPVSTTLLTALALWSLWLWERHRLGGAVTLQPPAAAPTFPPLPSPPGPGQPGGPYLVPVLPAVPGTPGAPLVFGGGHA